MAIIGGLDFGTLLTLFVVPAMYSYVTSKKARTELALEPAVAESPAA